MTTYSETTLPVLIGTLPAGQPKGDVPALGRLTVNEAQAVDQQWLIWGMETNDLYAHTDSTGSGALFYEAETRTAMGGSATAAGPSGASGGGSNVMRNTALLTSYMAILSTQATGAGAHLSHVGEFNIWARVQVPTTATGIVSLALLWGVGDLLQFQQNDSIDVPAKGVWCLMNLGSVTVRKVLTGTQRWEGRILAKSTVISDDIDVDCLFIVPVGVGSGVVTAVQQSSAPATVNAYDDFSTAVGALSGDVAPIGGTWGGAGSATDFALSTTGPTAFAEVRSATGDATNTGRYATLGSTNYAGVVVQADHYLTGTMVSGSRFGILARYVDTSNWLFAGIALHTATTFELHVLKRVAGTVTSLTPAGVTVPRAIGYFYTAKLAVQTNGQWTLSWNRTGAATTVVASGLDAVLATAGALQTGLPGIYDEAPDNTFARYYDNFLCYPAPALDAAVFASRALEIRHDGVQRQDSTGAFWQPASSYEGDLLRVPVTGREQRSVRFIVKASRNVPGAGPDSAIDDINATLAVTPRYLSVPVPA